jgi:hypothetical protein
MDDEGSNEEGKGAKAISMVIRVAGDEEGNNVGNMGGVQQRRQWQWWQEQWQ